MHSALILRIPLLALLFVLFAAGTSSATDQGWNAAIADSDLTPRRILAVDKNHQRFLIFERHSPLALRGAFPCTTGQADGDKSTEGDLRTPEGVYFIEGKRTSGLDYGLYGGIAYTLNYPNPVDRLRRKSGSGIWIHSKGRDITPRETRGCIALNRGDIDSLAGTLAPGTPVAVADSVASDASFSKQDIETARNLRDRVYAWARAWSARSQEMFSFYDPDAYSLAQDAPFHAFKGQKERLFKTLPWIHTTVHDVKVLQGPGYWVTWFDQYYRAPNHTSEGVRRLYWQPGKDGVMRIVGMEWIPADLGMEDDYLEDVSPRVAELIEQWRKAWETCDVDAYASWYAEDARQADRVGVAAIADHKRELWATIRPVKVALEGVRVAITPEGVIADMTQDYKDTRGYRDKGVKTIHLKPYGASWRIVREDWAPLP